MPPAPIRCDPVAQKKGFMIGVAFGLVWGCMLWGLKLFYRKCMCLPILKPMLNVGRFCSDCHVLENE